ncbi:hypothetical protein UK12_14285 [Saccharothrix sp. ST-888]|nr:hypothetical protein UK12_14285 [Saccharothrix sp. ST-888]
MTDTTTGTDGKAPAGRRERKKAATRRALADAALRLFLERGYEQVGIREIADAADVSTTTLFKHFPVKEAHFALEAPRAVRGHDDPRQALLRASDLLETGWGATVGQEGRRE